MAPECIALIPARAGSKRIPYKNVRLLQHHPLLGYTITAALDSGVFKRVIVSTDSQEVAVIARVYGAEVPFLRPAEYAQDSSPDIEWIRHLLNTLKEEGETAECFSILRPTSPFRKPDTIQRAWQAFLNDPQADSLRAVELCDQHPAKMWQIDANRMTPVMVNPNAEATPWHSSPYQSLPPVYAQNASLEIAWSRLPLEEGTIAGTQIMPFITQGYEGFDINHPVDWVVAESLVQSRSAQLPEARSVL